MSLPEDISPQEQTEEDLPRDAGPDLDAAASVSDPESSSGYWDLLDQYSRLGAPSEGEVVRGRVLKVTAGEVVVDIGCKSEGLIPLEEFLRSDGSIEVRPGDEIDVLVESAEDREGHIVLSREKAERISAWDEIEQAFNHQTVVNGVILERVKGGLSVDIGVKAFLPGSQVDLRPVKNLDSLKGMTVECRVIKINKRRGNVVLSRKVVLEERLNERRQILLQSLHEGMVVQGVVKNLTDYGVFVDLGGIDGLLHISDISWGRLAHPSESFSAGQQIQVKVLRFDRERLRVSLGYKQLFPDPWINVAEKYAVGERVRGRVVSLTDYGVFLEVEPGVEGLIHVSELSWGRRTKSPLRLFSVGDPLEAVVLNIHPQDRRMSLGLKQLKPDPWSTLAATYAPGTVIQGVVRNLTDFGAFVEVEEGIDGLVHISDLSWTRRVKHPSEILRKGQHVSAVVLHADPANHRLSLGIKQLQPDVWETFFSTHQVGDRVKGTITRSTSFGFFVELEAGIEGLCHYSQASESSEKPEAMPVGSVREFRIVRLQPNEKKIGLSLKLDEPTGSQNPGARTEKASAQAATSGARLGQGANPQHSGTWEWLTPGEPDTQGFQNRSEDKAGNERK